MHKNMNKLKVVKMINFMLYICYHNNFLRFYLFIFLEKVEEREKERERNNDR